VIARFPNPPAQPKVNPLGVALALHSEAAEAEHEESLGWVRWMFQSIRIRRDAIVFESDATERSGIIADWQTFGEGLWHAALAPTLMTAWKAAEANDVRGLLAAGDALSGLLPEGARERSAAAGELLLRATQGALHQGILGRLRQELENGRAEAHLAIVWAAVAVLFQMPPSDMLTEYLREEWLTALREHPQPHEPQGPVSFSALAHRALRAHGSLRGISA
jgi:hypothetical protein